MVALAPNTSETSTWDVLETFPKLHSRAREVKTSICAEAMPSNSLGRVEIWQVVYDCRDGLESFTRDPIGFDGSKWDLYEFVEASPLQDLDPSGLFVDSVTACMLKPDPVEQLACLEILVATGVDKTGKIRMLISKIKFGRPSPIRTPTPTPPIKAPLPGPTSGPVPNPDPGIGPTILIVGTIWNACVKELTHPIKPPRYPPTNPENPEGDDDCTLFRSEPPKAGESCYMCIYVCPGPPKNALPSAPVRYQPGGCHKNAKFVEGWAPGDHPGQGGDGKTLCEANGGKIPLPILGPWK